jgi:transcriptional regulator with XRE-family HTH domain
MGDDDDLATHLTETEAETLWLLRDPELIISDIADRLGVTAGEVIHRGSGIADSLRSLFPDDDLAYEPVPLRLMVRDLQNQARETKQPGWRETTNKALMEATGIPEARFQRFINGESFPEPSQIEVILDKLGVPRGRAEAMVAQFDLESAAYRRQWLAARAITGPTPAPATGLGPAIAELRRQRGMPRAELAAALSGVALVTVDQKLRGAAPLDKSEAFQLLAALGVSGEEAEAFVAQHRPEGESPVVDPRSITHTAGTTIRESLGQSGHTQAWLADRAGVSLSVVEKTLRGTNFPTVDVIERLLRVAGMPGADISAVLEEYERQANVRAAALMDQRWRVRKEKG